MRESEYPHGGGGGSRDLCSPIRPTTERNRHSGFQGFAGDFQRPTTATSSTLANMTALTAMRTVPSICRWKSYGPGISICPRYLSQLSKCKHGATSAVNWPRADARITHRPSHSIRARGLLKKRKHPPGHGKRKPARNPPPPVGSGLRDGGEGGQEKKRRVHLRRGTTTV